MHEVEDLDRLFRQVHRVLRAGCAFVFSHEHPMRLAVGRDDNEPGGLPLGRLEVRRSYFDPSPIVTTRDGEEIQVWPRTIADVFSALHRAGYRVDVLLEPEVLRTVRPRTGRPDVDSLAGAQGRRLTRRVRPAPAPTRGAARPLRPRRSRLPPDGSP